MTVIIDAESEKLLQLQLQAGAFSSAAEAVAVAVKRMFGCEATPELESLLDEALAHTGRRIPLSELRAQG